MTDASSSSSDDEGVIGFVGGLGQLTDREPIIFLSGATVNIHNRFYLGIRRVNCIQN